MAELEVLRAIADMVENELADDEFDMDIWQSDCGTVGCAFGHAVAKGLVPGVFLAEGLIGKRPVFRQSGTTELSAASDSLGLTHDEACDLFLPSRYPGMLANRSQVVTRIKQFVERQA